MSDGMNWVDPKNLQLRFNRPLLIEVDGNRSDLSSKYCEVVDVQNTPTGFFTILHVPSGTLPCETKRAMSISYPEKQKKEVVRVRIEQEPTRPGCDMWSF